jgi:probable HAF family extracellular repeat protein
MKRQFIVACSLMVVAFFYLAGSAVAMKFRYENLGTLGGTQSYTGFALKEAGINNAGQVAGKSYTAGGSLHAFVRSPGQAMVDLGNIPGSTESLASCINSSGVVGGNYQSGSSYACFWRPEGGGYSIQPLGVNVRQVGGINDDGYLVGAALFPGGDHGFVKPPGPAPPLQDLNTLPGHLGSRATGINSSRTIVGSSYDNSYIYTACVWHASGAGYTAAEPLFGVADSWALAVNNSNQAVGYVVISLVPHPVLKSPGEPMQDLGSLLPGGTGTAYDINDSGWVVGSAYNFGNQYAFLYTPAGGMQDLHNLVVHLPPGVRLQKAMAINKQGEIAGYTANSVFKLIPIAEPPLSLLLLE